VVAPEKEPNRLRSDAKGLAESFREARSDVLDCSRLIFLEQIAGCDKLGRLLPRFAVSIVGGISKAIKSRSDD
jgi:hypothetical protein